MMRSSTMQVESRRGRLRAALCGSPILLRACVRRCVRRCVGGRPCADARARAPAHAQVARPRASAGVAAVPRERAGRRGRGQRQRAARPRPAGRDAVPRRQRRSPRQGEAGGGPPRAGSAGGARARRCGQGGSGRAEGPGGRAGAEGIRYVSSSPAPRQAACLSCVWGGHLDSWGSSRPSVDLHSTLESLTRSLPRASAHIAARFEPVKVSHNSVVAASPAHPLFSTLSPALTAEAIFLETDLLPEGRSQGLWTDSGVDPLQNHLCRLSRFLTASCFTMCFLRLLPDGTCWEKLRTGEATEFAIDPVND